MQVIQPTIDAQARNQIKIILWAFVIQLMVFCFAYSHIQQELVEIKSALQALTPTPTSTTSKNSTTYHEPHQKRSSSAEEDDLSHFKNAEESPTNTEHVTIISPETHSETGAITG